MAKSELIPQWEVTELGNKTINAVSVLGIFIISITLIFFSCNQNDTTNHGNGLTLSGQNKIISPQSNLCESSMKHGQNRELIFDFKPLLNNKQIDKNLLENDCLKLLDKLAKPEDKGKLYSSLAYLFIDEPAKKIEYINLAKQYPLDMMTTLNLNMSLSSSYGEVSDKSNSAESLKKRILPLLEGFKLIADNIKEKKYNSPTWEVAQERTWKIPSCKPTPVSGDMVSDECRKFRDQYINELEFQNDLVIARHHYLIMITQIYTQNKNIDAGAKSGLKKLATEIIKDDAAVNEIMDYVNGKVMPIRTIDYETP